MKLKDWQKGLICTAFFVAVVFGGAYLVEGPENQYVVTYKQDGKISYRDLDGRRVHLMEFGADTANVNRDVYSNINVGDTISGNARIMKKPVAESAYYPDGALAMKRNTIRAINGVDVRTLARRMNAKQR